MNHTTRLLLAIAAAALAPFLVLAQSGRPDDSKSQSPPSTSSSKRVKRTPHKMTPPKEEPVASLAIDANPADSIVFVDGSEAVRTTVPGNFRVENLKAAVPHMVIARRTGYRDLSKTIYLEPGTSATINLNLEALPGNLSVSPGLSEAQIVIRRSDTRAEVTTRTGSITNLELASGPYVIEISKNGFKPLQKGIFILPGQAVYIEPRLEPFDAPTPVSTQQNSVPLSRPHSVKGKDATNSIDTATDVASDGAATDPITDAVVVRKARPAFPPAARAMRTFGTVKVLVAIDENGNVTSAKATNGPAVFYSSVEQAAKRWKFTPAMRGGKPISSSQTILFTFQLD